jgi:tetratricopeptide (TPR) repeat protein
MADRFTYLPSIGIAVMLAWGVPLLFPRADMRKKILFPAGVAFITILSFITWQQCGYWKNSLDLFNHTLQVTKDNYLAHNNRGSAYDKLGQYQNAIEDFNKTIRLKPDYTLAYYNRGTVYGEFDQHQRAIDDFNRAIRLKQDYADAYYNRGLAYLLQGNNELGCIDAQKACELGNCKALEWAKDKGICR